MWKSLTVLSQCYPVRECDLKSHLSKSFQKNQCTKLARKVMFTMCKKQCSESDQCQTRLIYECNEPSFLCSCQWHTFSPNAFNTKSLSSAGIAFRQQIAFVVADSLLMWNWCLQQRKRFKKRIWKRFVKANLKAICKSESESDLKCEKRFSSKCSKRKKRNRANIPSTRSSRV